MDDVIDLIHGSVESKFVGHRGMGKAAQLAHELQAGRANLQVCGAWFEIMQGLDAAAHGIIAFQSCGGRAFEQGEGPDGRV